MVINWIKPTGILGRYQDNRISKNSGVSGTFNAGCQSIEIISGDADIETTIVESNTQRAIGLQAYTTSGVTTYTTMAVSIRFETGATYAIYLGSSAQVGTGATGSYAASDVFRIRILSSVVSIYKNGTLVYTTSLTPTFPYRVSAAMSTTAATLDATVATGTGVATGISYQTYAYYKTRYGVAILFGGIHPAPIGSETGQNYPRGGNRSSI